MPGGAIIYHVSIKCTPPPRCLFAGRRFWNNTGIPWPLINCQMSPKNGSWEFSITSLFHYFWLISCVLFSASIMADFRGFPKKYKKNGAAKTLGARSVKALNPALYTDVHVCICIQAYPLTLLCVSYRITLVLTIQQPNRSMLSSDA